MKITVRWVNGLVFGISHVYALNFDAIPDDEMTMEEKMKIVPKNPVIFVYIGPFHFIITW